MGRAGACVKRHVRMGPIGTPDASPPAATGGVICRMDGTKGSTDANAREL